MGEAPSPFSSPFCHPFSVTVVCPAYAQLFLMPCGKYENKFGLYSVLLGSWSHKTSMKRGKIASRDQWYHFTDTEQNHEPGPQATERHCKVKILVMIFWVILSKTLISSDMVAELSFAYIRFFEMLPATLFIFLILVKFQLCSLKTHQWTIMFEFWLKQATWG